MESRTRDALEFLLEGEIAAIESYDRALGRIDRDGRAQRLQGIKADHEHAAHAIRALLASDPGPGIAGSGPWGNFARAAETIATMIGDEPTLRTLELGEEHGCDLYQAALEEPGLAPEARRLIRTLLLPCCRDHRTALRQMLRHRP